jgi:hypothetical protein
MMPILVHSVHSFCDDTTISHSLIFRLVACIFLLRDCSHMPSEIDGVARVQVHQGKNRCACTRAIDGGELLCQL